MASVFNPTDKTISVTIKGNTYTVGPNETKSGIPLEVAQDWKANTHEFISISEGDVAPEKPVEKKESVAAPVEEVETVVSPKKTSKK